MRILALVSVAFSAAIFSANYILPKGLLLPAAVLVLLLPLAGMIPKLKKYRRLLLLVSLPFAAGLLLFRVHTAVTADKAAASAGTEQQIELRLTADPAIYEDYSRCEVKILSGTGKGRKAVLYVSDDTLTGRLAGDVLIAECTYSDAGIKYGEKYDNYYSKGIYYILKADTVCWTGETNRLLSFPQTIRRYCCERIAQLFPADTAAFMQSLLLGEKSDLYADTSLYYSMKQAGFMHIVAVSGMHLSYLVAVVQCLFGKKRFSVPFCLTVMWLFALTAGFGPSVVRAAFMQTVYLCAPLLGREKDPLTALGFALAVILAANPYSAASISLQLSFGAMAGILLITDKLTLPEGKPANQFLRSIVLKLWGPFTATVGVLVFTMPLSAIHFGSFSIVSPFTNIAAGWAIPVAFIFGWGILLLDILFKPICLISAAAAGCLLKFTVTLAQIAAIPAKYIMFVARIAAKLPFASVYFNHPVMKLWLLLVYILIGIALCASMRTLWKVLLPAAVGISTLVLSLALTRAEFRTGDAWFTAVSVGQGQSLCLMQGDHTAVIDCGCTYSLTNAGDTMGAYLRSCGRTEIDTLILTHLHADHANGVRELLEYAAVGEIIMPADPDDTDELLPEILAACEEKSIPIRYISADEELSIGTFSIAVFAPSDVGDTNERCLCMRISDKDTDILVTGDAPRSVEADLTERYNLSGTEILIAGHHGSRYSSSGTLLEAAGGNTAIVSCGYNTYGHPTYEALERLAAYGYNIYRTDLNGNVTIRIPG